MLKIKNNLLFLILIMSLIGFQIGCNNQENAKYKILYRGNFVALFFDFNEGRLSSIDPSQLSPDKSKMIFVKSVEKKLNGKSNGITEETVNFIVKDFKTKKDNILYQIKNYNPDSSGKTPLISACYSWQDNSKYITLIVRSLKGKKSKVKIFNINVDSGQIKQANMPKLEFFYTHYRNDLFDNLSWSSDGNKILTITRRAKGSVNIMTIYEYDVKKDNIREIFKTIDQIEAYVWSPDSTQFALSIRDISHGQGRYYPVEDVYAPSSIWLKKLKNRDVAEVLHNKKYEREYRVQDWSHDGIWLLFLVRNLAIKKGQYLFNLETKKIYTMDLPKKLKGGTILGWSESGKDLLVVNKEGIWSLDFESIPKQKTSM